MALNFKSFIPQPRRVAPLPFSWQLWFMRGLSAVVRILEKGVGSKENKDLPGFWCRVSQKKHPSDWVWCPFSDCRKYWVLNLEFYGFMNYYNSCNCHYNNNNHSSAMLSASCITLYFFLKIILCSDITISVLRMRKWRFRHIAWLAKLGKGGLCLALLQNSSKELLILLHSAYPPVSLFFKNIFMWIGNILMGFKIEEPQLGM